MVLTYEIYRILEEEVGRERAEKIGKLIESALEQVEEKAREQKSVIKAQLRDELRKELASKEDIALVRQEIETVRQELKGEIKALEEKMKRWLLILGFLIVFTNQNTVTFLLKLAGVLK